MLVDAFDLGIEAMLGIGRSIYVASLEELGHSLDAAGSTSTTEVWGRQAACVLEAL